RKEVNAMNKTGLALTLALALPLGARTAAPQAVPPNPDQLTFQPITYAPPRAAEHRVVLKNGMVVFIMEDRTLPLVNVALTVRTGSYLEPAGKEGLAAFTGSLIRRGGTKTLSAEQPDEKRHLPGAPVGRGTGD